MIVGQVALVDPAKVSPPTFFIASLVVERERPELLERLRRWLAAEERIQQVFYVTGEADFILVVTADGVEAYNALTRRLLADNDNVRRFTTSVALATPKRTLFVPIETNGE